MSNFPVTTALPNPVAAIQSTAPVAMVGAVSEWDFADTTTTTPDSIGSNDISYTGTPTVSATGVAAAGSLQGDTGIFVPAEYTVACVAKRDSTAARYLFGLGETGGTDYYYGPTYASGAERYRFSGGFGRGDDLINPGIIGAWQFYYFSVSMTDDTAFCQAGDLSRARIAPTNRVDAYPGAGTLPLTFFAVDGVSNTEATGAVAWAAYFDSYNPDPGKSAQLKAYATSLLAGRGVAL